MGPITRAVKRHDGAHRRHGVDHGDGNRQIIREIDVGSLEVVRRGGLGPGRKDGESRLEVAGGEGRVHACLPAQEGVVKAGHGLSAWILRVKTREQLLGDHDVGRPPARHANPTPVNPPEHVLDGGTLGVCEALQALPRPVGADLRKLGGQALELLDGALLLPAIQGRIVHPRHSRPGQAFDSQPAAAFAGVARARRMRSRRPTTRP